MTTSYYVLQNVAQVRQVQEIHLGDLQSAGGVSKGIIVRGKHCEGSSAGEHSVKASLRNKGDTCSSNLLQSNQLPR